MLQQTRHIFFIILCSVFANTLLAGDSTYYKLEPQGIYGIRSFTGLSHYKNGILFATTVAAPDTTKPLYLDMWYCLKDSAGIRWGEPLLFSEQINSNFHDGPGVLSKDGNTIYFTRNIQSEKNIFRKTKTINSLQLFQSMYSNSNWSKPKIIELGSTENSYGHPAISNDGKTLYFISNKSGGYGKTDIYRSTFDGTIWNTPINMGATLNTDGSEMFPVVVGDTLYFVSDRHNSQGGFDIFKICINNIETQKVIRLPEPINSNSNETGILPVAGTNEYYFISDRNSSGTNNELIKAELIIIKDTLPQYVDRLVYALRRAIVPIAVPDSSIRVLLNKASVETLKKIEVLIGRVEMETDSIKKEQQKEELIGSLEKVDGFFAVIKNEFNKLKQAAISRKEEREKERILAEETGKKNKTAKQKAKSETQAQTKTETKEKPGSENHITTPKPEDNTITQTNSEDQELQQVLSELEQLYVSQNRDPSEAIQEVKTMNEINNSYYYAAEQQKLELIKENEKKEMSKNIISKFGSDNPYTRLLDIIDAHERDEKNRKK